MPLMWGKCWKTPTCCFEISFRVIDFNQYCFILSILLLKRRTLYWLRNVENVIYFYLKFLNFSIYQSERSEILLSVLLRAITGFIRGWGGDERLPEYILLTWILIASFLSFSTSFNTQMYHLIFITRITKLKSVSLDLKTKL